MLDTGNIQKLDKVKGDKANQERHELTRVSGIGKTMNDGTVKNTGLFLLECALGSPSE
jgi:hypothetical protein